MLYSKEQLDEIEKGKEFGLLKEEISLYSKPYFSYMQMREIRMGLEAGIGMRLVKTYAHWYYSHNKMAVFRQRIQNNEIFYKENNTILYFLLFAFSIFLFIFSLYVFYYEFFLYPPKLTLNAEIVDIRCGEKIDINNLVESNISSSIQNNNKINTSLPGTYFIEYYAKNGNKGTSKSIRVRLTDNRPPEIILKENKVTIDDTNNFHCKDYIESVKDNVSTNNIQVGCSDLLDSTLEEQDILYTAIDKYGNVGYAKLTVKNSSIQYSN